MATKEYKEGEIVPGKGRLLPNGQYAPVSSNVGKAGTGYWSESGWVEGTPSQEYLRRAGTTLEGLGFTQSALTSTLSSNSDFLKNAEREGYGYYNENGVFVPNRNEEVATRAGYYGEEAAENLRSSESRYIERSLNKAQAFGFAKQYGLQGLVNDSEFVGLTPTQARIKAEKLKKQKLSQVSAGTSYNYNPESINNFKKGFDDLKLSLDDNNNYPWNTKQTKKDKNKALIDSYSKTLGSSFNSLEEFQNAQQDPEFARVLADFERMGGSRNAVASNITKGINPQTGEIINPTEQDIQSFNQQYSTYSPQNIGNQTVDQYLGAMNTKPQQMAMETLIPEKKIAQDQIAFEASIPEKYREYYFGTPEQIGFLDKEAQLAKESINILKRKAENEKENARAQAELLADQQEFELQKESAEIERNRLTAKNYVMGALAKLGALKTTGVAPAKIAELEQKYQEQAQNLRTTYSLKNRELQVKLKDEVNNIETDRDTNILKVKEDLSKSEEDVFKEIFKLQNDSDRKIFSIVDNFSKDFRTQTESYRKELKSDAEKYAKKLAAAASKYDPTAIYRMNLGEGDIGIMRNKSGKITDVGFARPDGVESLDAFLENQADANGYVPADIWKATFDKFLKAGGTRDEFISKYPPNQWVNPKESSLPSFLKFGSSARSEVNDEGTDWESLLD